MRRHLLSVITALVVPAAAQSTGGVTGVVPLLKRPAGRIAVEKYTGTISGKVAKAPPPCAGVWLEGPGTKAEPRQEKVVLAQRGYQFCESLIIIAPGTIVEFPNEDPDYHNVLSLTTAKRFDIGRYKKDEKPVPREIFDKPCFIRLGCEIHDHMSAAVLVVDSRWRTRSGPDGKFILSGVTPGTYTLHARMDAKNHWSVPVRIEAGKTIEVKFEAEGVVP